MMTVEEIDIKLDLIAKEMIVRDRRIELMNVRYWSGGTEPFQTFMLERRGEDGPPLYGRAVWGYTPPGVVFEEVSWPYKGLEEGKNGALFSVFSFDVTGKQDFFELERAAKQAWGRLYERITGQGSRAPV